MMDYEPTEEELVEYEESLIRAYRTVEKGSIGKEKLKQMWIRDQKEKEICKMSKELTLNLIRDVFPNVDESVCRKFLLKYKNPKDMITWFEILARIEMRKLKALETIAEKI